MTLLLTALLAWCALSVVVAVALSLVHRGARLGERAMAEALAASAPHADAHADLDEPVGADAVDVPAQVTVADRDEVELGTANAA